jgi:hypothetical protein
LQSRAGPVVDSSREGHRCGAQAAVAGDTAIPAAWAFFTGTRAPVPETPFATGALLDTVRRIASRMSHQGH